MTTETTIEHKQEQEAQVPSPYFVRVLDDNVTTVDFVVDLAQSLFGLTLNQANQFAFDVHFDGHADSGPYTKDVAETKAAEGVRQARDAQFPLQIIVIDEKG